jgi:hypothetical protein
MPNTNENLIRDLLNSGSDLKVSQLTKLVGPRDLCHDAYFQARETWGKYFQSPVDKLATTSKDLFPFDHLGSFQGADQEKLGQTINALFPEPESHDPDLRNWLHTGEPLSAEKIDLIRRTVFKKSLKLTNESLFDQPICRLVHRNQLRLDLDYQVPYQLTPGQIRLIHPDEERRMELEDLRRNQRWYWGLSETFQRLVALFDSDLGSSKPPNESRKSMTKEFIRLRSEEGNSEDDLAPNELNELSPLRFWAPPPAFADSVFHMIFWKSVITGRDLFGRLVVEEEDIDSPEIRAQHYYVLINWFNAAKFRIADYERLFEALMAIARRVGELGERSQALHIFRKAVPLNDEPKGLLYPSYFPDSKVRFPRFQKVGLVLPFDKVSKSDEKTWELPWEHQSNKEQKETTIGDLLVFLRDKALEVIIWSKYQMEIRSVGLIPVQHLYNLELTDVGKEVLNRLAGKWRPGVADEAKAEINTRIKEAIFDETVDEWVALKKVYGGTYRRIYLKDRWNKIDALRRIEKSKKDI